MSISSIDDDADYADALCTKRKGLHTSKQHTADLGTVQVVVLSDDLVSQLYGLPVLAVVNGICRGGGGGGVGRRSRDTQAALVQLLSTAPRAP